MRIVANGKEAVAVSQLSYEEGVAMHLWREGDTVTYQGPRIGGKQRAGVLAPDGSVELEEGMKFTAAFTGNA